MAKALLGYRVATDRRLMLEAVELRRRVRDLERLVARSSWTTTGCGRI